MIIEFLLLLAGLALLYYGSEFLVKGAASTAILFAVRPVIVGLTVVAFATSAPELLVSLVASVKGSGDISVGNILGSNVINIALVLGLSALIRPIKINGRIAQVEMPIMVFVCVLFYVICLDGVIGWGDGALLLAILVLFLGYSIWTARDKNGDTVREKPTVRALFRNGVMIVGGLIGLAKGADMVVQSAIIMAREIGLSEAFIGISIVALGTSLPELATSAVAAAQGESDISVGNVVGSNIFNVCMVMGLVGLIQPMTLDKSLLTFEFPFMIFIALFLQAVCWWRKGIGRLAGGVFVLLFILYIIGALL
ncbi:cation:H+ antiporter [Desulfocicer vacuolatum DSM 3385]|uniref:Cation:H+ antiporter n=1 Tax=Desulfocicer vacuolatum DSM 3385 TaxID=1121400 RepID=A0A1W1Z7D3_9BACT|nr:calcium/sodium antiporter [Desulfocicer vacuolatum]SMC44212.1 cation:H+ antiporter [Desulfocicer vacuolatum DSM 3385]